MEITALLLLSSIQVKHWIVDFCIQTDAEVVSKGHYGELTGILHSAKHGIGTGVIFLFIDPYLAPIMVLFDSYLHYHIDWAKRNFGNQDIQNPKFWAHLGLDQMAHQLCYIGYVAMVVL